MFLRKKYTITINNRSPMDKKVWRTVRTIQCIDVDSLNSELFTNASEVANIFKNNKAPETDSI